MKNGNELLDIESINQEADSLVRRFKDDIREDIQVIAGISANSQIFKQKQEERKQLAKAKRQKIVRIKSNSNEELISDTVIQEQVATFDEEIKEFMSSPMTSKHKNSILLLSQDLHELEKSDIDNERKSKRIQRLFEEYEKLTGRIQREVGEMVAVYEEYKRECFDSEKPALSINEFSTTKEITEAIKAVRCAAETNMSKDYIRRQIDDVMSKHGYNVVSSELLQEANDSGQVLYGVNDDTAIKRSFGAWPHYENMDNQSF